MITSSRRIAPTATPIASECRRQVLGRAEDDQPDRTDEAARHDPDIEPTQDDPAGGEPGRDPADAGRGIQEPGRSLAGTERVDRDDDGQDAERATGEAGRRVQHDDPREPTDDGAPASRDGRLDLRRALRCGPCPRRPRSASDGSGGSRASPTTNANVAALSRKAMASPPVAMTIPAIAGPTK